MKNSREKLPRTRMWMDRCSRRQCNSNSLVGPTTDQLLVLAMQVVQ